MFVLELSFFSHFNFLLLISVNVSIYSFAYFARQRLFLMFSFEILRGKLACSRSQLIPLRMPDV